MTQINTVADFKRVMVPGSVWRATHQYIGQHPTEPKDLGVRECGHVNTVNFGFKFSPESEKAGRISYSDWPKAKEFTGGFNKVTIEKEGFVRLVYEKVEGSANA